MHGRGQKRRRLGPRQGRRLRGRIAGLLALLGCFCGPVAGHAHLIDEVAESIVVDIRTLDRRLFELTFVLHSERLEAYFHQAEQLGIDTKRSDLGFAQRLAAGFRFGACELKPAPTGAVARPVRGGRFRAFRLVARCDAPVEHALLARADYDRAKTRTTLYLTVRVGDTPTRRLLLPPRLSGLDVPLTGGAPHTMAASPKRRAGPPAQRTPSPADPVDLSHLPTAATATSAWRRSLTPPPARILQIWAESGARHLAGGLDHLLFLLALTLAALRYPRLVLGAMAFSVGHMLTMAAAIAWAWPPVAAIEVAIGLSIVWSAWRARQPGLGRAELLGAFAFGLIHGTAFGTELRHLVGGSEGLLWPVLSFGVGLDVAQLLWISVAFVLWTPIRRRIAPKQPLPAAQRIAGALLIAAGLAFAMRAVWRAL